MTCRTYPKKEMILHIIYIIFLTIIGVLCVISAIFLLLNIVSLDDKISVCFTIFFALLILSVDFFECRAMGALLFMNDDGIGVKRFGKVKVFINWNDIKEIGLGKIPTPFGNKERVYFCDRKLDEKEKRDLIILKYHTVHFSYIPKDWYSKIINRINIPMHNEIKEKYVK